MLHLMVTITDRHRLADFISPYRTNILSIILHCGMVWLPMKYLICYLAEKEELYVLRLLMMKLVFSKRTLEENENRRSRHRIVHRSRAVSVDAGT